MRNSSGKLERGPSKMYMFNEFDTPEAALNHMLDKGENTYRGTTTVWLTYTQLGGGNKVTGAHGITRKTLEGRLYVVNWCNEIVEVEFTDCVFIDHIKGRSYPEKVRCEVVMFPSNEVFS